MSAGQARQDRHAFVGTAGQGGSKPLRCAIYTRKSTESGLEHGGFSGGSLERPSIQRLLAEVRAGRVDVIVVYKVDRLTRSLSDFAKLVDLFDQRIT